MQRAAADMSASARTSAACRRRVSCGRIYLNIGSPSYRARVRVSSNRGFLPQHHETVSSLVCRSSFVCGPATRVHGHQIFVDGAFNGDPHPGNILLTPDGKLGLIDYGQVRARVLGPSQGESGKYRLKAAIRLHNIYIYYCLHVCTGGGAQRPFYSG